MCTSLSLVILYQRASGTGTHTVLQESSKPASAPAKSGK
jgi:hypothetical protein